jgi:hypothetical protein
MMGVAKIGFFFKRAGFGSNDCRTREENGAANVVALLQALHASLQTRRLASFSDFW